MAITLKNSWVERKNHSFLANWADWELSSPHLLRLETDLSVHLFLDCTVSRPLLRKFLHSFTPPHYACCISLLVLVLSHSDTHHLNRHMAWCGCHERSNQSGSSQGYMAQCGCHEILTQRRITVLVFCRIYLGIRSNYDFGGSATRIIHFNWLVFSTVFITPIR